MKKVTFQADNILVDGAVIGRLDGSKEVYVRLMSDEDHEGHPGIKRFETVARFKYKSPRASAKHFLKFVLAIRTPAELVVAFRKEPPLTFAERLGYVSLIKQQMLKKQADHEISLRATFAFVGNHV